MKNKTDEMNNNYLKHITAGCMLAALAAAAMLATSCHKDITAESKAVKISADAVYPLSFSSGDAAGIFGYIHKTAAGLDKTDDRPDFFLGQRLDLNGNSCTYSPEKYWPRTAGESISFIGYYPFADGDNGMEILDLNGADYANGSVGLPCIKYTLPAGTSDMHEIAVSGIATSAGDDINLAFSSVLANILIYISYDGIESARPGISAIHLERVKITGIFTSGIYDCSEKEWTSHSAKGTVKVDNGTLSDIVDIKDFAGTVTSESFPILPQTLPSEAAIVVSGSYDEYGITRTFTTSVPLSGEWTKKDTFAYGITINSDIL